MEGIRARFKGTEEKLRLMLEVLEKSPEITVISHSDIMRMADTNRYKRLYVDYDIAGKEKTNNNSDNNT